jgi:hypothetical protein
MKHAAVCIAMTAAFGMSALAQQGGGFGGGATAGARAAIEGDIQSMMAVRPRAALETRVTKGAPYSGEAITEFVQALPDGNRITRKSVTRTYRDSEGRTRREQTIVAAAGETLSVTITDPVAGASFILEPETRTAWRNRAIVAMPSTVAPSAGGGGRGGGFAVLSPPAGAAPAAVPAGQAEQIDEQKRREAETNARVALAEDARAMAGQLKMAQERAASGESKTTREDLGQRMIEGVMAEGTRSTTMIPAGGVGNEQPLTIVSEQWFSPELQVFVYTRHSDPRSGETTYRLANIVRAEQDRSLFEVPPDYTLKETGIRRPSSGVFYRQ